MYSRNIEYLLGQDIYHTLFVMPVSQIVSNSAPTDVLMLLERGKPAMCDTAYLFLQVNMPAIKNTVPTTQ